MGVDLSNVHVTVDDLPQIELPNPMVVAIQGPIDSSITVKSPLPVIHLALDSLPTIQLGDVNLNMSIKEIPSIRAHLPADFCVGLSVMGMELLNVRLCGEAQVITEPYKPNPCEPCGSGAALDRYALAGVPRLVSNG
jgi:hypothetical protein